MIKRFIWDLDGTILDGDFSIEEKLFKDNLSNIYFIEIILVINNIIIHK